MRNVTTNNTIDDRFGFWLLQGKHFEDCDWTQFLNKPLLSLKFIVVTHTAYFKLQIIVCGSEWNFEASKFSVMFLNS